MEKGSQITIIYSMNPFTIAVIVMGGICFYVGLYHMGLFLRRPRQKENLAFAFTCVLIGLYDFLCAGLYNASSVSQGMAWQKLQFAVLSLFTISLMWFYYQVFPGIPKKLFRFFAIAFCILLILGLVVGGDLTLTESVSNIKTIEFSKDLSITYHEAEPGLIYTIQYIFMFISYTAVIILSIKNIIKRKEKHMAAIIITMLAFYPAAVNDILVGAGVYPFIYVMEYSYLFIIIGMAYVLSSRFMDLHSEVEDLNVNLEHKVKERTRELLEARDALWGEMQLARKIQTVLLPTAPTLEGHEIAAYMNPVDEVGGDYYDVLTIEGKQWLIIGDVSGHGVAAGLIMMMVDTAISSVLHKEPNFSPTELLDIVNSVLIDNLKKIGEDRYMTITVFAYQENGVYHFSGMHQDILIYKAQKGKVDPVSSKGIWLGVESHFVPERKDMALTLETGDVMLLYTDGILEAKDNQNSMFQLEKLNSFLEKNGRLSAMEIKQALLDELKGYNQKDDVTFMIVKRTE